MIRSPTMMSSEVYYNPESGLVSAQELYRRINQGKHSDDKYTHKEIKEWLDKQQVNQLHSRQGTKRYHPIFGDPGTYQLDLTFFEQYKRSNGGYYIILSIINVNTKKAYARALKTKKAFEEVIQEIRKDGPSVGMLNEISIVGFVGGSEFKGEFKRVLDKYNIDSYTSDSGDKTKMGVVERFNRTLRERIERYLTAYDTNRWVDQLQPIINNYNASRHSSIGQTPDSVTAKDERRIIDEQKQKANRVTSQNESYQVGETVRLLKSKGAFEKGATERYYKGIYTITERNPFSYKIKNEKGDELARTIKPYELQRVGEVQKLEIEKPSKGESPDVTDYVSREQEIRQHKHEKRLTREGVDTSNIIVGSRRARN
eukprot:Lithocolla_globosa_v1_NODE_569_length_3713_cov_366.818480.p1 type:complete len:371 gc:universal NODE_569_length_3713_cov_366.818480:95-1207(+)